MLGQKPALGLVSGSTLIRNRLSGSAGDAPRSAVRRGVRTCATITRWSGLKGLSSSFSSSGPGSTAIPGGVSGTGSASSGTPSSRIDVRSSLLSRTAALLASSAAEILSWSAIVTVRKSVTSPGIGSRSRMTSRSRRGSRRLTCFARSARTSCTATSGSSGPITGCAASVTGATVWGCKAAAAATVPSRRTPCRVAKKVLIASLVATAETPSRTMPASTGLVASFVASSLSSTI